MTEKHEIDRYKKLELEVMIIFIVDKSVFNLFLINRLIAQSIKCQKIVRNVQGDACFVKPAA